ncbi:HEAT repeat domain-containing protein [Yinghuangia sp. YIM S09857]|uniref:HEAT repeat domain-containing protein n=1 Tax=Yinghuangia sp. YIM S09857 TaxID=3436929 RepID=UPI003F537477
MSELVHEQLRAVAINPAAPEDVLLRMLSGPRWLALAVSGRPAAPVGVINALVTHKDSSVRMAFAGNLQMRWQDRERLEKDPHFGVRLTLAEGASRAAVEHRPAPTALLERLARDEDARVRSQIACSPDLPPLLAEALVGDDDALTRENVCRRYWDVLDPAARDALIADDDREVRLAALLMRDKSESGAARALLRAGVGELDVATHCVLDAEVSAQLVNTGDSRTKRAAAQNPTLHPVAVARLGRDDDVTVRLAVSVRQDLTDEQRLAVDFGPGLDNWLSDLPVPWIENNLGSPTVMSQCANSGHVLLRRGAARSPTLSADDVAVLAPTAIARCDWPCADTTPQRRWTYSWSLPPTPITGTDGHCGGPRPSRRAD